MMEKTGKSAALKKFDKKWARDSGVITCGYCKMTFCIEDGCGKRVCLLFKNRHKGLCEVCIAEIRPRKKLRVHRIFREWFAEMDRRCKKDEEQEEALLFDMDPRVSSKSPRTKSNNSVPGGA